MRYLLFLIFVPSVVFAVESFRPEGFTLSAKGMEIGLDVDHTMTTGTYDSEGTSTPLTDTYGDGSKASSTDFEGLLRYGVTKLFEFRVGARGRLNQVTYGEKSWTRSGLESVIGGARFAAVKTRDVGFALDFSFRKTVYSKDEPGTDKIPLGDNIDRASPGVAFSLRPSSGFAATATAHVDFRSGGEEGYVYGNVVRLNFQAAGIGKVATLFGGVQTSNELSGTTINDVESEKSSKVSPYVGLSFLIGDAVRLQFRGSTDISGKNDDKNNVFGLNLMYVTDGQNPVDVVKKSFKEYKVEAEVIQVSPKGKFIKIDKGVSDDLNKGAEVDIYTDGELVAAGVVFKAGSSSAVVSITKMYRQITIEPGFVVRAKLSESEESDFSGQE